MKQATWSSFVTVTTGESEILFGATLLVKSTKINMWRLWQILQLTGGTLSAGMMVSAILELDLEDSTLN